MEIYKKYMRLCLKLAENGRDRVKPNPMVGCIIVKNGKIIGRGYHSKFGGPHAEINAIKEAGQKAKNAVMFVNLEPCCREYPGKKTPPCAPEIIKAGIKKIFVSMSDPNPEVNGKGLRYLKDNGVEVSTGILKKESQELNKVYCKWIKYKLPYTIIKTAVSLDGKISTNTGESKWITSKQAREYVLKLRASVDGVLVGINTVIKDNPYLTLHKKYPDKRNPLRVVLDPHLKIPLNSNVLNKDAETLIITEDNKNIRKLKFLYKKNVKIVFLKKSVDGYFDFKSVMEVLAGYNIYSLLIEGGGTTNSIAIESGWVDEVYFFISPIIIGGKNAITAVEGRGINRLDDCIELKNLTVEKIGRDLLIKGRIKKDVHRYN